jgi:SAM-dependent methyltransferase
MSHLICRGCGAEVRESLVDLGVQPLSNAYVDPADANRPEVFYPLHPMVCERCFLVQIGVFEPPERIFTNYAYFSSYSTSWLEHCRLHVDRSIERLGLGADSFVVEVASNDGYLLKRFVERGVRVLGIEPAENVAEAARTAGVPTSVVFFGAESADRVAAEHGKAHMMLANNVLAHVPDIHDFIEGFRRLLAPGGIATFEFPHLVPLMLQTQFDTIYHEHFSYLSLLSVEPILEAHGLHVVDVDQVATHGGSLRMWVAHRDAPIEIAPSVERVRQLEAATGLHDMKTYREFGGRVRRVKRALLQFLIGASDEGRKVVAYGAAAKGNTLLNYCGIREDLVAFVVDRNPHKQGLLLPGSRLPIASVDALFDARPDYVLILPWNLTAEITEQIGAIREWGGRFAVSIPELAVIS